MSKTAILNLGAAYFIKCLSENSAITLDEVIFANIEGVNSHTDIDLGRTMPLDEQVVHTMDVTKAGLINDRTVVYSTILDTTVGDFSFNFIGLVNRETKTLCMALHTDLTKKIKTVGQQQGNTITESIWLEMDNASTSTGITVNAETWQIDFSNRLAGEDERIRQTNLDLYGRIRVTDGLAITKEGNRCTINSGTVYIAGLRVHHKLDETVQIENGESLYIDASLEGSTTGAWQVHYKILSGFNLHDYQDGIFTHYVEKIATIDGDGNITAIKSNRVLTEFDKSSAIDADSELTVATSRAVKQAYDLAGNAKSDVKKAQSKADDALLIGEFKLFPFRKEDLPRGWYFRNGDNYLFSSKQGQALNSLSANYKADHNITIKLLNGEYYINVPNAFNSSGYGYFERPVNGISRRVGSTQDDAMRLLVGKFGRIAGLNFSNSGSLYGTNPLASGIQSGSGGAQYVDLNFDNRLATIVAEENRPMNYGMTPAIYLGV